MSIHYFPRRAVLGLIASSAVLPVLNGPALALTEAAAKNLVVSLVDDINGVIASEKSERAMILDFERIFAQYADIPIIARYALGADARTADSEQISNFTKAFQGYIARKYGRRFREFIGGRIEVESARAIRSGFEVKTIAYLRGQSPFDVTFLVSDRSGKNLFFNMFIEGVNMLLTERAEIGALLDQRGRDLNRLIRDMPSLG
ncbi:MAG: ABC transporter substrate-binding protein [Rhodobacteraceae bacterium]|nr:ABC transporter substrate-binding protein [Paracoccaceae bacterium]